MRSNTYLKEANLEDYQEEFEAISKFKIIENGFSNKFARMDKEAFLNIGLPYMINRPKKIDLKEGIVPQTYFFLWKDDLIIGLVKIRHELTPELKEGAGHIGFGIIPEYRNKGYGKIALKLAIEKCREIIKKEKEIYLCCFKSNLASLAVQINNGAYIDHEDENNYFMRIKL